jgi:hypothetical protein
LNRAPALIVGHGQVKAFSADVAGMRRIRRSCTDDVGKSRLHRYVKSAETPPLQV